MRAELLLRADDRQAAVPAFEEAVALCRNEPEGEYLELRLTETRSALSR